MGWEPFRAFKTYNFVRLKIIPRACAAQLCGWCPVYNSAGRQIRSLCRMFSFPDSTVTFKFEIGFPYFFFCLPGLLASIAAANRMCAILWVRRASSRAVSARFHALFWCTGVGSQQSGDRFFATICTHAPAPSPLAEWEPLRRMGIERQVLFLIVCVPIPNCT